MSLFPGAAAVIACDVEAIIGTKYAVLIDVVASS